MKENVSFDQTKESLGSILLLWSQVERAARDEVRIAHDGQISKTVYGISAVLNARETAIGDAQNASPFRTFLALTLRAQLQHQLDIQNGLCHGLVGASAENDNQPATLTWQINDETRSVTWQELQVNLAWLSKVPLATRIISNHSRDKSGSRFIDSPENRNWWKSEYGHEIRKAE